MKKFSTIKLAFATLAFALALCASARAQDSKGGEAVVRERRATATADATKPAAESKPAQSDKSVDASSSASPASSPASPSKSSASSTLPAAASSDDVEELKAQIASASNPSERGRLRQTLAARLADAGRKAEAVELLRSMLAEERFDPPFFYNTGNALARLGESNAAVDAYRKAISQRHGNYSRAQNNLGVVLMRLGRWDESEEALTNALKLENYNYAEASYSLGRLHALRGEAGLAIAEWQRTLRLDPNHVDAVVALARALAEDGDPAQALAVLDSFTTRAGKGVANVPREVAIARGEIVAATNVAEEERTERRSSEMIEASKPLPGSRPDTNSRPERIPQSEKTSPSTLREARSSSKPLHSLVVGREAYSLLMNARDARAENHDAEAVALYRKAIEANGGYFAPASIELGYTLTGLHRNEEAAASLLVVLRKEGSHYPVAYYHLGRIYEHLGRVEEAGEAFQRAAELMGETSPQFYVDVSRVREREGRYADALAAAEQYVRLMAQTGGVPDWAGECVNSLRKKVEQNASRSANN
jgi:tetratricopeptide (TPR) repeat protein